MAATGQRGNGGNGGDDPDDDGGNGGDPDDDGDNGGDPDDDGGDSGGGPAGLNVLTQAAQNLTTTRYRIVYSLMATEPGELRYLRHLHDRFRPAPFRLHHRWQPGRWGETIAI